MDNKFNKISSLLYRLVELDVHSMMVCDLAHLVRLDQENLSIYLINTIPYIEYYYIQNMQCDGSRKARKGIHCKRSSMEWLTLSS